MSARNIVVTIMVLLAAFGLISGIFLDTSRTLLALGIFLLSALFIVFIAKLAFNSSASQNSESKAYRKAVKQAKNRNKQIKKTTYTRPLKVRKRDASHLRVIEGGGKGKKSKKKIN